MFCYYCGREISDDSDFCTFCGKKVMGNNSFRRNFPEAPYSEPVPVIKNKKEDVNNKNVALLVCITVLVLIICVLLAIILINAKGNSDKKEGKEIVTPAPTVTSTEIPLPTIAPTSQPDKKFERTTLYNSSYTYERMNDIYSSRPANDDEAFEMETLISDYNNAWIDYVNYYYTDVYDYLREGTRPYSTAEKYKDKNITESFLLMDVLDVRQTDNYYYVWTHEIIKEHNNDNGAEKELEYHWVYRIAEDMQGYYIYDCIDDPAYK